jgi:hypothetical protein
MSSIPSHEKNVRSMALNYAQLEFEAELERSWAISTFGDHHDKTKLADDMRQKTESARKAFEFYVHTIKTP